MEIKMRGLLQEVSNLLFFLPFLLLRSIHYPSPSPAWCLRPSLVSRFAMLRPTARAACSSVRITMDIRFIINDEKSFRGERASEIGR